MLTPELDGRLLALWLALVFDRLVHDPPNPLHPVAWMGSGIAAFRRCAPTVGRWRPLLAGLLLLGVGGGAVAAAGLGLTWAWRRAFGPFAWIGEAVVLRLCLSANGLFRAGRAVQAALEQGDLPLARRLVGYHLVSRPTSELNASQTAAATVESLAENTSDSLVAPLLYFTLGGLPAALFYRFANTCDAMLGYRDERHEWLGKVPARLDDVLNFLPARLTAVLVLAAGLLRREDVRRGARIWRRDCRATASPNAGHPMSAAAGVLGVELEKVGCYRLGAGLPAPGPADISRSIPLLGIVVVLAAAVCSLLRLLLARIEACHGLGLF